MVAAQAKANEKGTEGINIKLDEITEGQEALRRAVRSIGSLLNNRVTYPEYRASSVITIIDTFLVL
jgi:hypothetical protein